MDKKVYVDIREGHYTLNGDIDSILKNRRFLLSLKRLDYSNRENEIIVPFSKESRIDTLQDIQELLQKFGYAYVFLDNIEKELYAYKKEQDNFKEFSERARQIRNNHFSENPELVDDFRRFKEVMEKRLRRPLYPLQMLSAFHMAFSQNSCNFAVPGAGKTSIVYAAYAYMKSLPKNNPRRVDKILVIGPLSSFAPWENEYVDCFGKKIESQRLSGDASISRRRKEQHLYSNSPKELTLISHAGVPLMEKEIIDFLKHNRTMVVIDEAHRMKNAKGVRGQSIVEIGKIATSRIILTGTPVPNGYEDLYNLFRFIYPFKYKEILQIHYEQLRELTKNSISVEDKRVQSFVKNINPYFVRIKKKDLKLPEAKENIVYIDMDESQRKIYDFIAEKYIKSFRHNPSGTIKDILNKAKLIRLRQAATNPALLIKPLRESLEDSKYGSDPNIDFAKIDNETIDDSLFFAKIKNYSISNIPQKFISINEILKGDIFTRDGKAVIWTVFIQNAEDLQRYLARADIKSELLIGRVPQEEREAVIEKFNNPDNHDFQVLIANPFSVSESISLHKGCHNAIYMERDYNCANFLQSKDRIHRVGLPKEVQTNYFYLISTESIDSIINEKLNDKVERMEKIINEEIPLFARINDSDETDIIKSLLDDYARRA